MTNDFISGALLGAIVAVLAYWCTLRACRDAPAGSARERLAGILGAGGGGPARPRGAGGNGPARQ